MPNACGSPFKAARGLTPSLRHTFPEAGAASMRWGRWDRNLGRGLGRLPKIALWKHTPGEREAEE
jgi:hypothetical protein